MTRHRPAKQRIRFAFQLIIQVSHADAAEAGMAKVPPSKKERNVAANQAAGAVFVVAAKLVDRFEPDLLDRLSGLGVREGRAGMAWIGPFR